MNCKVFLKCCQALFSLAPKKDLTRGKAFLTIWCTMKTLSVVRHFGGKAALAQKLGIRVQSLYDWGPYVPFQRQREIEDLTRGKFPAMTWREWRRAKARRRAA